MFLLLSTHNSTFIKRIGRRKKKNNRRRRNAFAVITKYKFVPKITERVRAVWAPGPRPGQPTSPRNRQIIITYVPPSTDVSCVIIYFLCRKRWAFGFCECDRIFIVLREALFGLRFQFFRCVR